jgi:hypothetical protein
VFVALLAWLITLVGLLRRLVALARVTRPFVA